MSDLSDSSRGERRPGCCLENFFQVIDSMGATFCWHLMSNRRPTLQAALRGFLSLLGDTTQPQAEPHNQNLSPPLPKARLPSRVYEKNSHIVVHYFDCIPNLVSPPVLVIFGFHCFFYFHFFFQRYAMGSCHSHISIFYKLYIVICIRAISCHYRVGVEESGREAFGSRDGLCEAYSRSLSFTWAFCGDNWILRAVNPGYFFADADGGDGNDFSFSRDVRFPPSVWGPDTWVGKRWECQT